MPKEGEIGEDMVLSSSPKAWRKVMRGMGLTYAFDLDGVICETQGMDYANATPKRRNIEKINTLYDEGHYIMVYTGRGAKTGIDWRELTEKQFRDWGLKYNELRFGKPPFDIFVDDHAWNVRDFEQGAIE